jgi:hypothetical protein
MPKGMRFGLSVSLLAALLALSQVVMTTAAPLRFGARLTTDTQPQPALWCDEPNDTAPHSNCTWIMNEAYGRPSGGQRAPKTGTIGRVRLMSCTPGSFRVQVARRVPGTTKYRVVRDGPRIQYQGDLQGCGDNDDFVYRIESFRTNFHVRKGDRIAIKTKRTGTLRCGSGGPHTLLFSPPLVAGGSARRASDTQGCFLLIEWQYK